MNKEEILNSIKDLAKYQGFYCRILKAIKEDETILDKLAELNFKDSVDLVLYFES